MREERNNLDYRTLMDQIEMPSQVKDHIRSATRRVRAEESARVTSRRVARPLPRRRFVGVAFAGACALAFGGTAVFAAIAKRPADTALIPAGNSFTLVAYANENPSGEPGKTVTLNINDFGHDSAWKVWHSDPEIDPNNADNAPDSGQRYLSVAYQFNLSCTGNNIDSLTYEVEGDRVLFYTHTVEWGPTPRNSGPEVNSEFRATSFTVDYDEQDYHEQASTGTIVWRGLRVSFPLEGEVAELYDAVMAEFYSYTPDVDYERQDRLSVLLLRRYADMISQARLRLTATYKDGTTESKTFVIAPIENLEEAELSYLTGLRAQAAVPYGEPTTPPQLFTLTELA